MKTLLNQRREQLKEAQDNYVEAMRKAYPVNSEILFYRHSNQDIPYSGVVHYIDTHSIVVRMPERYKKQYWHIRHGQVV
jgi:hypothetical protein